MSAADTRTSRSPLAAATGALFAVSIVETLLIPWPAFVSMPTLALPSWGSTLARSLPFLGGIIGFFALLGIIEELWASRPAVAVQRVVTTTVACVGAVGSSFVTLGRYEPFRLHVPTLVAFAALLLFTIVTTLAPAFARRLRFERFPIFVATVSLIGAGGALWLNLNIHKGRYPTLHLALLQTSYLLTGLALWRMPRIRRTLLPWTPIGIAIVITAVGLEHVGAFAGAAPYVGGHTTVGQSRIIYRPYTGDEEVPRGGWRPDRAADKRFARHSGLPALPTTFDLTQHNVLLVSIEATRFDQTSLANPKFDTTPNLKRLVNMGAFSFTHAYAPSSGTLHSMSSILSMRPPSMVKLETWKRPWYGRLLRDSGYVPEIFRRSLYSTFWIGHNYRTAFDNMMLGFERGFTRRHLFSERHVGDVSAVDSHITKAALSALRLASRAPRRFFGWIFFVSPHGSYHAHYDQLPRETALDRYRQELRYSDEQLGRLIDHLQTVGKLNDTVVIVHGDHGEEFEEHGGTRHKTTVYAESLHVPLVIWIPGVQGVSMEQPTSLTHVFPWLLLRGNALMRHEARLRLRDDIGPMMRATGNAIVSELLGHDRMRSSLIYPDYKINYDFVSGLYETFDLRVDPREQRDLFVRDAEVAKLTRRRITAYRDVRAHRKQFVMLPDRLPAPVIRKRRKISVMPEL